MLWVIIFYIRAFASFFYKCALCVYKRYKIYSNDILAKYDIRWWYTNRYFDGLPVYETIYERYTNNIRNDSHLWLILELHDTDTFQKKKWYRYFSKKTIPILSDTEKADARYRYQIFLSIMIMRIIWQTTNHSYLYHIKNCWKIRAHQDQRGSTMRSIFTKLVRTLGIRTGAEVPIW